VYLAELHRRLIETAQRRVRGGYISERGLARLCGMSQPHMHNVLKQIRSLSTDSADRLMQALQISVADLLWSVGAESEVPMGAVPVVKSRIGPGTEVNLGIFRGIMPLSGHLLHWLFDPLVARLTPDLVLPRQLAGNDMVLLDQNPVIRKRPGGSGVWVVAEEGGLRARYLRMGGTLLYIANEMTLADPQKWLPIPPGEQNILEIVRAKIVWLGREMEKEPA
jgi:hypothetical protein